MSLPYIKLYIYFIFKLADATKQQIGVPETMIVSAVSGVIYALFSGQPLIITGKNNVSSIKECISTVKLCLNDSAIC